MSAKDQIKQIVDYFKREPQLKDKTDGMAEGLLLGANLADDANELSKETDASLKALQREYTENGNGSQSTAEITVARDGELVLDDRLKRDFGNINAQLAQTIYNLNQLMINVATPPYNVNPTSTSVSATEGINAAIEFASSKGGGTVYVPSHSSSYMIDSLTSILAKNNVRLLLEKGAVLEAIANDATHYSVIKVENVVNFSISGGKIVGDRNSHLGVEGEWGHGVNITGSTDVSVDNIEIEDCWGDGIYIGRTYTQAYCKNVDIRRIKLDNNRRQGISIVSAIDLTIDSGRIQNTNGTAPADGIDIEPNDNTDYLQNITIRKITTEDNEGDGIKIFLGNYKLSKNEISITIEDHRDFNSFSGFRAVGYVPNVKGVIKLINSRLEHGTRKTFRVLDWASTGPRIEAVDPTVVWNGTIVDDIFGYYVGFTTPSEGLIMGNVHLTRPNLILGSGAVAPLRGIFLSGLNGTKINTLENITIIDPIALPSSLPNAQMSIDRTCKNLKVEDRYKILHKSTALSDSISGWMYKRTYDNKGSSETVTFTVNSDAYIGQEFTITNVETKAIKIVPSVNYPRFILPYTTTATKGILTQYKGAKITIVVGEDGNLYVKDVVGIWTENS